MDHELQSEDLDQAIGRVWHAVADDEARPILATILFEGDGEGFRLVAADNYRLVVATVSIADHADFGRVPVAREFIPTLRAFLKIRKRTVIVAVGDRTVTVRDPYGSVALRTVDGQYPNYAEILPKANDAPLGINPAYLADTAKATKGLPAVKLHKADGKRAPFIIEGEGYTEAIMPIAPVV